MSKHVFGIITVGVGGLTLGCGGIDLGSAVDLVADNVPAKVFAFGPESVQEGERVFLEGILESNIQGPDAEAPTFQWSQLDGPPIVLEGDDTLDSAHFLAPIVDEDAKITLVVSTTASNGQVISDHLTIAVLDAGINNRPPIAHAGRAQLVAPGAEVTLSGEESRDGDGMDLEFAWTQIEGPEVDILLSQESYALFMAPQVGDKTRLRFMLTVTDAMGFSDDDTVTVTVVP